MKLPRGYSISITLKTADPGLATLSPEDASGQELGSEPSRIFVAGGAYESVPKIFSALRQTKKHVAS